MVQSPEYTTNFSFLQSDWTDLELAQPPSQWIPEALFLSVKQLRHEADDSPPSTAEDECEYTSIPQ
jgi:hypothetical protein